MKKYEGLDALSALSDILFEETGAPIPSFPAQARKIRVRTKAEPESADIVDPRSTWQPAP